MIFRPKQKKPLASSPMKIDNTVSEEVEHITFLGVNIDQHLAWKTHINFVCTKISKTIGMLYKAWFYVTRKSLLSLYLSLVYPYLTYHNVAWSSTYPTNINRIYLLQKRIVRTICAADHRAPGKPLIQNLAFLKFIAYFHSKSDPSCLSFQNLFQTGSKIHNYYTRYAESQCPHARRASKKIYNIIPRTKTVELFTSLNNCFKQQNNL